VEEHVLLDVFVAEAQLARADPGVHDHRDGQQKVDRDDREHRDGRRATRRLLGVLRLLVHREGDVPPPEDEDRQRQARGERAERADGERVEPADVERLEVEALPLTASTIAAIAKNSSTATWKVTSTYCSFWVVCMSR
jgi:hypothetical protein